MCSKELANRSTIGLKLKNWQTCLYFWLGIEYSSVLVLQAVSVNAVSIVAPAGAGAAVLSPARLSVVRAWAVLAGAGVLAPARPAPAGVVAAVAGLAVPGGAAVPVGVTLSLLQLWVPG